MTDYASKTYSFLNYTLVCTEEVDGMYTYSYKDAKVSINLHHDTCEKVLSAKADMTIRLPGYTTLQLQSSREDRTPWRNTTPESALQVLTENYAAARSLPWL